MRVAILLILMIAGVGLIVAGISSKTTEKPLPPNTDTTVIETEDVSVSLESEQAASKTKSPIIETSQKKEPLTAVETTPPSKKSISGESSTAVETNPPPQESSSEEAPVAENVVQLPAPEVTFQASSIIIEDGDPLTLTWNVKNADSCKSSGFLAYGKMSGDLKFNPSRDVTYELHCSGEGGEVSKSIKVVVIPPNATGVTLQSSALDITSKDSVILTWASVNASSCNGVGFSGSGTKGQVTVSPQKTIIYRIDCNNSTTGANADSSVTVNVTYIEENTGPPDTVPPVVSDGSPMGAFSATTTSVVLSVNTDEPASCKHTLFAGTIFSDMISFGPINAIEHSTTIGGLLPNATYRYYVRCEDEAGNQNTVDYPIEFDIGNP